MPTGATADNVMKAATSPEKGLSEISMSDVLGGHLLVDGINNYLYVSDAGYMVLYEEESHQPSLCVMFANQWCTKRKLNVGSCQLASALLTVRLRPKSYDERSVADIAVNGITEEEKRKIDGNGHFLVDKDASLLIDYDGDADPHELSRIVERFALSRIADLVNRDLRVDAKRLAVGEPEKRKTMVSMLRKYEGFRSTANLVGEVFDSGACNVTATDFDSGLEVLRHAIEVQTLDRNRRSDFRSRILNTIMLSISSVAFPQGLVELSEKWPWWNEPAQVYLHVPSGYALFIVTCLLLILGMIYTWRDNKR